MNKYCIVLRQFAFWMLFAFVCRVTFILYFHEQLSNLCIADTLKIFIYGTRMDASMAAYVCGIPLLVFIAQLWITDFKIFRKFSRFYVWMVIIVCSLINIINFNIYREWDTLISYKVVDMFLDSPHLAIASAASSPIFLSIFILLFLSIIGALLAKKLKIYEPTIKKGSIKWYQKLTASGSLLLLLFLLIRGGWGLTPLNPSMVYFATAPFPNHAATNVVWYFMYDMVHAKGLKKNPYKAMKENEAKQLISPIIAPSSNSASLSILNTKRPNVVFIILESFTADLVESLGGEKGVAPKLEQLIKEGLLFDHIYSSGDRTDKGIIALLSAFPTQSSQSIIKNIHKQAELPSLVSDFAAAGYRTSFYYGGESEFYNFKGYMLSHGCQKIVDQQHFPLWAARSKWGVYDELTFTKQLNQLSKAKEPFFSVLLTLNNHEPFDLPVPHKFGDDDLPNLFRSTAYYTDSVLYNYLEQAKKTAWYKNTLFVIVADHGHRLPLEQWESNNPKRYHIPLLFFGGALKASRKGKRNDIIGNQVDIASTLCNQLGFSAKHYVWSRDLLNPRTVPFSFFTWSDGWGIVKTNESMAYDHIGEHVSFYEGNHHCYTHKCTVLKQGKAYLQEVYNQYLSY